MAEKRMISRKVIESDVFMDMPLSSQALYFHLCLQADDDGFVNNPKMIQRMIGASLDDLNVLIAKNFVLRFDSGVVVVTHWKVHNYIPKDRYKPSCYIEEKKTLDNGLERTKKGFEGFKSLKAFPNCRKRQVYRKQNVLNINLSKK